MADAGTKYEYDYVTLQPVFMPEALATDAAILIDPKGEAKFNPAAPQEERELVIGYTEMSPADPHPSEAQINRFAEIIYELRGRHAFPADENGNIPLHISEAFEESAISPLYAAAGMPDSKSPTHFESYINFLAERSPSMAIGTLHERQAAEAAGLEWHLNQGGASPGDPESLEFLERIAEFQNKIVELSSHTKEKPAAEESFLQSAYQTAAGTGRNIAETAGRIAGPMAQSTAAAFAGALAGGGIGGFFGGSSVWAKGAYGASIIKSFLENGADLRDPQSVLDLYSQPDVITEIRERAAEQAALTGLILPVTGRAVSSLGKTEMHTILAKHFNEHYAWLLKDIEDIAGKGAAKVANKGIRSLLGPTEEAATISAANRLQP